MKKPSSKNSYLELDADERELFLNDFFQRKPVKVYVEKNDEVSSSPNTPPKKRSEDDSALFLQAVNEVSQIALKKIRDAESPYEQPLKHARRRNVVNAKIDLHGLFAEDAVNALYRFLEHEKRRGSRLVLVVHGKGAGVLKNAVCSLLATHPFVENFYCAPSKLGGAGALLVRIGKKFNKF